jgi:hypothetical protein
MIRQARDQQDVGRKLSTLKMDAIYSSEIFGSFFSEVPAL